MHTVKHDNLFACPRPLILNYSVCCSRCSHTMHRPEKTYVGEFQGLPLLCHCIAILSPRTFIVFVHCGLAVTSTSFVVALWHHGAPCSLWVLAAWWSTYVRDLSTTSTPKGSLIFIVTIAKMFGIPGFCKMGYCSKTHDQAISIQLSRFCSECIDLSFSQPSPSW